MLDPPSEHKKENKYNVQVRIPAKKQRNGQELVNRPVNFKRQEKVDKKMHIRISSQGHIESVPRSREADEKTYDELVKEAFERVC